MKKYIIGFLFIGFSVFAQDCEKLTIKKEDKVTGISSYINKKSFLFYSDGINYKTQKACIITTIKSEGDLYLYFNIDNICFDFKNPIQILFRDGTRLKTGNFMEFNCKGNSVILLSKNLNPENELWLLTKKEVETIRITHSSGSYDFQFSEKESKKVLETIQCLNNLPNT